MSPVKGVRRPRGVNWLVESSLPTPKGGEKKVLRRDVRQPCQGEVLDLAVGPTDSIGELQASYRSRGIETKRAESGKSGEDVLIAYVPEGDYENPTRQLLEEAKSAISNLIGRRK